MGQNTQRIDLTIESTIKSLRAYLAEKDLKNLNHATMVICAYAETCKSRKQEIIPLGGDGLPTEIGNKLQLLVRDAYELCFQLCESESTLIKNAMNDGIISPNSFEAEVNRVRFENLQNYVMIYSATKYIPHGEYLQPMAEEFLRYFHYRPNVRTEVEKEMIGKFVELALQCYDKLATFRIIVRDFPDFVSYEQKTKALAIAYVFGDRLIIDELHFSFLKRPKD